MSKQFIVNSTQATSYKIEKGIPIVGGTRNPNAWRRYPLDKMKVGDSFLIPEGDPNAKPHLIQPAVKNYNRNYNLTTKFVARAMPNGRRVWRIQ
jgi:hypothetical protein